MAGMDRNDGAFPRPDRAAHWPLARLCFSMGLGPLRAETANVTLRSIPCPAKFSPPSPLSPSRRPARPNPSRCRWSRSRSNRPIRANTAAKPGGRPSGRPQPQPEWGAGPKRARIDRAGRCLGIGSCILWSMKCHPNPCCFSFSSRCPRVVPRLPATARWANPWAAATTDAKSAVARCAARLAEAAILSVTVSDYGSAPIPALGRFDGGAPC